MKYKAGSFCFVAVKRKKKHTLRYISGTQRWQAMAGCVQAWMYAAICISCMHACLMQPNLSHGARKKSPSPCLSDMQRRLNSLMNSQVTRGLNYYSPTPPYTHDHTHIKHTFTRAHIKTRRPTRPWWSTRQSNVPGICSCLVWRVFPTLPPSPGSRQHQLPQWWESRPLWRAEEGRVGGGV